MLVWMMKESSADCDSIPPHQESLPVSQPLTQKVEEREGKEESDSTTFVIPFLNQIKFGIERINFNCDTKKIGSFLSINQETLGKSRDEGKKLMGKEGMM